MHYRRKMKEIMPQNELTTQIDILKQKIIVSRKHLNELWNTYGVTNSAVLAASIELDHLIVEYLELQKEILKLQQ